MVPIPNVNEEQITCVGYQITLYWIHYEFYNHFNINKKSQREREKKEREGERDER